MANDSAEEFKNPQELQPRSLPNVYMITYSQADSTKCPDRKAFADCVLNAFNF